jgi:hypothetical protein
MDAASPCVASVPSVAERNSGSIAQKFSNRILRKMSMSQSKPKSDITLDSIPGYAIRGFLQLLSAARNERHPSLATCIQKYKLSHKVSGHELLTPRVIEFLSQQPIQTLWQHMTFIEREWQLSPCPETEQLPGDDSPPLLAGERNV